MSSHALTVFCKLDLGASISPFRNKSLTIYTKDSKYILDINKHISNKHIDVYNMEIQKISNTNNNDTIYNIMVIHHKSEKNYELIISELKSKIDYLQLTPAKRKKVDEAKSKTSESSNNVTVLEVVSDPNDPSATKDGGSF